MPKLDPAEDDLGRRLYAVVRDGAQDGLSPQSVVWSLVNLLAVVIADDPRAEQRTVTMKLIGDNLGQMVWRHVVARMMADQRAGEGHGQPLH